MKPGPDDLGGGPSALPADSHRCGRRNALIGGERGDEPTLPVFRGIITRER